MNIASLLETLPDVLETIQKLTHFGGEKAEAALVGIRAAVSALQHGIDGKLTKAEVLARIKALHDELASNDAEADAALKNKFRADTAKPE